MTIKSSGPLSMSEINAEFGRGYNLNAHRNIQWWLDDNSTGTFSSGTIGMNEFYGKRSNPLITSGSFYRSNAGPATFQLPYFNYVTVEIWGGGGGAGGSGGGSGGTTAVGIGPYYMQAYGGDGGGGNYRRTDSGGGGPGYAVGGQYNASGYSGGGGGYYVGGSGGGAVNGSGGSPGKGWNLGLGDYGGDPGGGQGAASGSDYREGNYNAGGGGGGGGYSSSTVYSAQVPWLTNINFTVGDGGYFNGGRGGIRFTWG